MTINAKSLLDTESVKFQVRNLLPITRNVRECIVNGALSGVSFTGILTVEAVMIQKMKWAKKKQPSSNYTMQSYVTPALRAPSGKFRRSNTLYNPKAAAIVYPVVHITD